METIPARNIREKYQYEVKNMIGSGNDRRQVEVASHDASPGPWSNVLYTPSFSHRAASFSPLIPFSCHPYSRVRTIQFLAKKNTP